MRVIEAAGLSVQISEGHHRIVIGIVGEEDRLRDIPLERFPGVEKVVPLKSPYRLVSRDARSSDSIVGVGTARIGEGLTIIAGPCAVEDDDSLLVAARAAKEAGAHLLRGGAFKPQGSCRRAPAPAHRRQRRGA